MDQMKSLTHPGDPNEEVAFVKLNFCTHLSDA